MGRLEDIVNADSLEALMRLREESGVDQALEQKKTPIQRAVARARDGESGSGVARAERDYVRDPIGQFASGGRRDSQRGKDDDKKPPRTAREHVVKPGDTLAEIAERELGDASRWTEIRDASGLGKDFDPRKLQVGTKLSLPPKDGKDDEGEGGRRRTADGGVDRDGDGDSDPARGRDGFTRVGSLEDVDRQVTGWEDNIKPAQRREQRRRLLARARELGASDRTLARIRALSVPNEEKDDDVSTMQTKGPAGVPADIEHKAAPTSAGVQVLETDDETGIVTALVSVTGVVDNVKDQIEPGAYTKTMAKREPIGVWSHDDKTWVARTEEAVELPPGDPFLRELKTMDGQPWDPRAGAVKVTARFNLETPHGKAAYSDVKFFQGKTGWSIGYRATKAHRNPKTGVRHIKELDWYEYSPVMVGAASQPMTLSVKSLAGAYAVDADDDTGLVDDAMLEELTLDELDRLDALKASLGLEVKARVRTPEGARRYGQPIGSVIIPDLVSSSVGAKELTSGMEVDFQGMGAGGPSDPVPVKGKIEKVSRDGNITMITVGGKDHKLIGNSPVKVTGGKGAGANESLSDKDLVTMLQEAEDDDERKLIRAAAALPADKRRAFLTSGGKEGGDDSAAGAGDKPAGDKPAAGTSKRLTDLEARLTKLQGLPSANASRGAVPDQIRDTRRAIIAERRRLEAEGGSGKPADSDAPRGSKADRDVIRDYLAQTGGGSVSEKDVDEFVDQYAGKAPAVGDGEDRISKAIAAISGKPTPKADTDKPADKPSARKPEMPTNDKGETPADFVNLVLADLREEEYRQLESEVQARLDDFEKEPTQNNASRLISVLKPINEDGIDGENIEDAIELLEKVKVAAPDADTPTTESRREAARQRARDADTAADARVREREKLAAYNRRRRAQGKPPVLTLPASMKSLDFAALTDDELELKFWDAVEAGEDVELGDPDDDLEEKGSRASLDRSPRANWVENAGELPGYVREVARAIEREQGLPLDRAIPIAIGRIKKWARGGGGVNADTVAKAAAAVAQWEALKAKNRAKYDSELLEQIEHKALVRMDLIEQLEADGVYSVELKSLVDDNAALADDLADLDDLVESKSLEPAGVDDELVELLARGAEVKGSASPVEDDDFEALLARRAELG